MTTKLLDANQELETLPDMAELDRLVEYYPTYEWERRKLLLYGYFQGKSLDELVEDKLKAQEIDISKCIPQSLGGHSRWVKSKVKKVIVRILYLRFRLNEDMTQRQANQKIYKKYSSEKGTKDGRQSTIRKMTRSPILDK